MKHAKVLPQLQYNQLNIIQKINAKSNTLNIIINPAIRVSKMTHLSSSMSYIWPQDYTVPFCDTYK